MHRWPDNAYGTKLSSQKGLNRVLWDRCGSSRTTPPPAARCRPCLPRRDSSTWFSEGFPTHLSGSACQYPLLFRIQFYEHVNEELVGRFHCLSLELSLPFHCLS